MNKILFNFLIVGVSLAGIQSATAMDVENENPAPRRKAPQNKTQKKKIYRNTMDVENSHSDLSSMKKWGDIETLSNHMIIENSNHYDQVIFREIQNTPQMQHVHHVHHVHHLYQIQHIHQVPVAGLQAINAFPESRNLFGNQNGMFM